MCPNRHCGLFERHEWYASCYIELHLVDPEARYMNLNIALLASSPRGKPWRSRLLPHLSAIAHWREEGKSYSEIAVSLRERGLHISGSAVHAFVRARDPDRAKRQYKLVESASVDSKTEPCDSRMPTLRTAPGEREDARFKQPVKKFVFHASASKAFHLTDDQLRINDPLGQQ